MVDVISRSIGETDFVGVVLSPNSVTSPWVKTELELALLNQIKPDRTKVLPLVLGEGAIADFLAGKKYIKFMAWNPGAHTEQYLDHLHNRVQEVAEARGIDQNDGERWSGKKMVSVSTFRAKVEKYFAPLKTTVTLHEDRSGIESIRVDNGDETFQLYEYWSKPSYLDVANAIFQRKNEPPIIGIKIVDAHCWTHEERIAAARKICRRHKVSPKLFWTKNPPPKAWRDYTDWLQDHQAISLVRKGDFGSENS